VASQAVQLRFPWVSSWRLMIDSILRRLRERGLVLAGALILFGTFVVNDILRERVKGLTEALNLAQHTSETREQFFQIMAQVDRRGSEPPQKGSDTSLSTAEHGWYVAGARQQNEIRTMIELAEKLPDPARKRKYLEFAARLDSLANQLVDGSLTIIRKKDALPGDELDETETQPKGLKREEFETAAITLSFKVPILIGNVLAEADRERDEQEARYRKYKMVSIGLYVLGWVLTVTGKLTGDDKEFGLAE
jgi:hypothetical protein